MRELTIEEMKLITGGRRGGGHGGHGAGRCGTMISAAISLNTSVGVLSIYI